MTVSVKYRDKFCLDSATIVHREGRGVGPGEVENARS